MSEKIAHSINDAQFMSFF